MSTSIQETHNYQRHAIYEYSATSENSITVEESNAESLSLNSNNADFEFIESAATNHNVMNAQPSACTTTKPTSTASEQDRLLHFPLNSEFKVFLAYNFISQLEIIILGKGWKL